MSYPHVTEEFPWGESAFKVKGKTFVFMREESAKLQQSHDFALTLPGSSRPWDRAGPRWLGAGVR